MSVCLCVYQVLPAQQTPDRLKFLVEIDVNYGAQVCESVKRALFDVNMAKETYLLKEAY